MRLVLLGYISCATSQRVNVAASCDTPCLQRSPAHAQASLYSTVHKRLHITCQPNLTYATCTVSNLTTATVVEASTQLISHHNFGSNHPQRHANPQRLYVQRQMPSAPTKLGKQNLRPSSATISIHPQATTSNTTTTATATASIAAATATTLKPKATPEPQTHLYPQLSPNPDVRTYDSRSGHSTTSCPPPPSSTHGTRLEV